MQIDCFGRTCLSLLYLNLFILLNQRIEVRKKKSLELKKIEPISAFVGETFSCCGFGFVRFQGNFVLRNFMKTVVIFSWIWNKSSHLNYAVILSWYIHVHEELNFLSIKYAKCVCVYLIILIDNFSFNSRVGCISFLSSSYLSNNDFN